MGAGSGLCYDAEVLQAVVYKGLVRFSNPFQSPGVLIYLPM